MPVIEAISIEAMANQPESNIRKGVKAGYSSMANGGGCTRLAAPRKPSRRKQRRESRRESSAACLWRCLMQKAGGWLAGLIMSDNTAKK